MKKAIFLSAILALYKKKETDVADHLKTVEGDDIDDSKVEEILKELDAEKITSFKNEAKDRFDNGVKKGQKETAIKFEKKLKSTFEIEEDIEGDELLNKVEEVAKSSKGSTGTKPDLNSLTKDDLEKVPAYINIQRDFQSQLSAKEAEKETAVAGVKAEIKKSTLKTKASSKALAKLNERNPILPKDSAKAEKQKQKLLIDELKDIEFMEAEDGALIPLDAEGKPRLNANGIQIDFDMLVTGIIDSNFEFEKVESRRSPANGKTEEGKTTVYTGKAPANATEYAQLLMSSELSVEERGALKEKYSETFSR